MADCELILARVALLLCLSYELYNFTLVIK